MVERLSAQSSALPCGSASSSSVGYISANAEDRLIESVVLPVPPFWLTMATTGMVTPSAMYIGRTRQMYIGTIELLSLSTAHHLYRR